MKRIILLIICVALCGIVSAQSIDTTFTVYGPRKYIRSSGTPKTVTENFAIPATAEPPYRLYIINGESDGSNRVSSAEIKMNGTLILRQSEINQQIAFLERQVNLSSTNRIEVQLTSQPRSFLVIGIAATDRTPPRLQVTSPIDNFITASSPVAVAGTVLDETLVSLTINGVAQPVSSDGSFSGQVSLTEGRNTITVLATDAFGNSSTQSRLVILDTTPPVLTVQTPANNSITNQSLVNVAGTVVDSTTVTVTVNGMPLTVASDGSFTGQVQLVEGSNFITFTATDAAGNTASLTRSVLRDSVPPDLTVFQPLDSTTTLDSIVTVSGTAVDATPIALTVNGDTVSVSPEGAFTTLIHLAPGTNEIFVQAKDAAENISSLSLLVTRLSIILPPDPATVAPPLDPINSTNLFDATAFLYTGSNPIQSGVAPGTIDRVRVAVIRGRVLSRDLNPLPGVRISFLKRPELGSTLSRADGRFDVAVNGGGILTVDYSKEGFLPAQRQAQPQWQDFITLEDVILVPLDDQVTTIDFTQPVHVARGSIVTDQAGTRQATLLFKQNTQVNLVFPRFSLGTALGCTGTASKTIQVGGDSLVPASSLNVRTTEYTVGSNGPRSMPALLPQTSGYTYAVEMSSDEAIAAQAREVRFSQPVSFYVENFLSFPVGTRVPSGFYDRKKGFWVPSPDGRVVRIVSTNAGLAEIDANGDGIADHPDSLALLGFNVAERERLAALYSVGQSLWRVEVTHFSTYDFNYGLRPASGAQSPNLQTPEKVTTENGAQTCGSIIDIIKQTLSEEFPITGTSLVFRYSSDRVNGSREPYALDISLSGSSIPSTVQKIVVEISVAGRIFSDTLPPTINLRYTFSWDGKDAYGRATQGKQPVFVRVGYVYPAFYQLPPALRNSFVALSGQLSLVPARQGITLWQDWRGMIGAWSPSPKDLAGMRLNVHHNYEPNGRVLHLGSGRDVNSTIIDNVITTIAGLPWGSYDLCNAAFRGDGGPATNARFAFPGPLIIGSDGTIILGQQFLIRRIGPDGIVSTIAGLANCISPAPPNLGDGRLANCAFAGTAYLAFGPDSSLYFADALANRIRKIDRDGVVTTIAGTCSGSCIGSFGSFGGDNGPAILAQLARPVGIAFAPDGTLYFSDSYNHRVRRISTDGIISTVAGTGVATFSGDGGPATQARLNFPRGIAVGPDGAIYVSDYSNHRIRRIGTDGIITTFAGGGPSLGDGGPAAQARVLFPEGLAFASDGTLYIVDFGQTRIRRVAPNGIITTVAGNGTNATFTGDNGPATAAGLFNPIGVAFGPDGNIYITDTQNQRIRKVAPPIPGVSVSEILVASEDGSEQYVFDLNGRHLRTLDALTAVVKYRFTYDAAGRLASLTDIDSLITRFERDGDGNLTAIVGPFGQRTGLTTNAAGYVTSMTNPANETTLLDYSADGLLTSKTDARGNTHRYFYDSRGRLIRDENAAGGFKTISRKDTTNAVELTVATAEGRVSKFMVERLSNGDTRLTNTDASGLKTITTDGTNGTTTTTTPDGTVITRTDGPDPRFGMQAPLMKNLTVRLPSNLQSTLTQSRTITQMTGQTVTGLVDTVRINSQPFVTAFDGNAKRYSNTTPEGRKTFVNVDNKGNVTVDSIPGFGAVKYSYDSKGRLTQSQRGGRVSNFTYTSKANLQVLLIPSDTRPASSMMRSVG